MKLIDLIDSSSYNLRNIFRYSNCNLINKESTAEHTILTELLAIHMYNTLNNPGFNLKEVIYRIAIHDLDECVMCDIPRDIKYYSRESYNMFNSIANDLLKTSGFKQEFINQINDAKHNCIEGELTGYLDVLQAFIKLYQEYKLQLSTSIHTRLVDCSVTLCNKIKEFSYIDSKSELGIYLNELTNDAINMIKELK